MIEGSEFIHKSKAYFAFLEQEFNYKVLSEKIRSNVFYDIHYINSYTIISISYENIDDVLLVTLYLLEDGKLPDYDDKTKTLHLNQLNLSLSTSIVNEIESNNDFFSRFVIKDDMDRKLIKCVRDLRLCLRNSNRLIGLV